MHSQQQSKNENETPSIISSEISIKNSAIASQEQCEIQEEIHSISENDNSMTCSHLDIEASKRYK